MIKETMNSYVERKVWGPDDDYMTVTVQVDKFRPGDKVKVTVEKIEQEMNKEQIEMFKYQQNSI